MNRDKTLTNWSSFQFYVFGYHILFKSYNKKGFKLVSSYTKHFPVHYSPFPPTPPTTQCNKRPQDCNLVLVQPTHTMCSKMNPQSFPMSSANTFLSLSNRTRLFKKQSGCREDLGNCCGNYFVTITKLPICAQLKHC